VRIFQRAADEVGAGGEIVVEARETLGEGAVEPGAEDYR
jgi:hypothetical protein